MNNRTIKFRVWNNKTKSWIHGPNKLECLDGINLLGENILFGNFLGEVGVENLNDIITLQFTGLKDKNGREIFEGDILQIPENNPESTSGAALVLVEYKYGTFGYKDCIKPRGGRFESLYELIGESETDDCAKIIGNIYDNPELIN